jgi:hypothetical protein
MSEKCRVKKEVSRLCWVVLLVLVLLPAAAIVAEEDDWPREIITPEGVVVMYQPQPEKMEGNQLEGRAAVAVELKGSTEPVYGVIWFEARLETDRAARTATIADVSVTNVRFPEADEQKSNKLAALLEEEIPKWQIPISLDRLLATLELAEKRVEAAEKINTDPPKILFVSEPAVLVTLDGEPRLKKEEGSELMRVINTPFTILFAPAEKTYYLCADVDAWYVATDLQGDWALAEKVPSEVAARAPKPEPDEEDKGVEEDEEEPGPPPKIIVATEPTELISIKGEPEYTPISGTDLLYMSNTDSDVLLHVKNQYHYVLLAGRWYASAKLEGPWRYVPGEDLSPDFAAIPEDSEMGTVLYAVPGTDVAKDAVMDAQIPQTAAIDPNKATLSVEYDGEPKFEAISGTEMTYAANTATPVIRAEGGYYACDDAVWFVADSAAGPWRVATSVPSAIYTIPSDSPVYNVTFVRIYDATPEVVYVGYTPGYTYTYVYHTTIVYGTGYYWPAWYGTYYYPRPATWGFHVRWNPWRGWGFGFSYGAGPFRFGIGFGGWHRGGWWGPGRHRGYRRGYRHGYRRGRNAGYRAGYRSGSRNASRNNLYSNKSNQARTAAPSKTGANRSQARTASKRANNVYADKNGNVHRKTDQGWQQRTSKGWQSEKAKPSQGQKPSQAQKPSQTQKSSRQAVGTSHSSGNRQLNQSYQARERGQQRASSYNRSRGGGHSRGGGRRGGGGRR